VSELRLQLAAHPLAFPFLRLVGRCGSVVPVPGVGVVVNDAALARQVLLDTAAFGKSGPGSSGALWTPVLGPSVLLNMDGAAHAALRRKLVGLFTPGAVDALVAGVLADPLDRATRELAAGRPVDVVDLARGCAGAVICAVIGLAADAAEHRRMFARGERIAALVRLTTRRLTARQVAAAQRVLGEITGPAGRAYDDDRDTLVARMRRAGLSRAEALGAAAAFFLTGTETVASFLPRLVALLCDTGRQGGAIERADLERALEEGLRHTTPSPVMLRSVAAPAAVGRWRVRPGQRVVIATYNCTRVRGGFAPERVPPDLGRLWFGAGPHFCIGYPLAMAQARAVASAVLAQGPLRVVRRRYARRVLIPGYRELVVARA
jgi:cytochrome P450